MFEAGQSIGELRIERELGRGAAGIVYLAKDRLLQRDVALKALPGVFDELSPVERDKILNEARLVAGLNSPYIVTLHRLHETPDGGWLQEMELADGGSLKDHFPEGEPVPIAEATRIFRCVCSALKTAHAARVIHGDVKAANVLFGRDGQVKLSDFGLARVVEEHRTSFPLEGVPVGTPYYMAPEVILGEEAGMASDVWAAGVLFYLLLTGRRPFEAKTLTDLMAAIEAADPEPLGPPVPEAVANLALRCLRRDPAERPSAADVVKELDRLTHADETLGVTPAPARTLNFHPPATRFVGREKELAQLRSALTEKPVRLLTLLGPGGIGKTRLAQQLCVDLLEEFDGGCRFIDLSEVRDVDGIAHAVAEALDVPLPKEGDAIEAIADVLQYRGSMLLVFDNFEQLLDHARETVGVWLRKAAKVRYIVTSRARLGLTGEQPVELHPLPAPPEQFDEDPDPHRAAEFAAVDLFVERARQAQPAFELDRENAAAVASICRELDGMPLAIELAAARTSLMQPRQIAQRLNQKFLLLKSSSRDLSPRQRTLLGAIEWSYELLDPHERVAFLQACYFREGFTLEAAEAVIDLDDDTLLVMDVLQGLREKSLVTAAHHGMETRIGMYRAIREFGEHKWKQASHHPREIALAHRHAEYYLAYAEEWNRRIPGPRDQEAFDRIDAEIGNLLCALEKGPPGNAARIALAAAETLKVRRAPRQLSATMEAGLAALPDGSPAVEARLRAYLATACYRSGDWDCATNHARLAAERAREAGDEAALGAALLQTGKMLRNRGELDDALARLEEAERVARAAGERATTAAAVAERGVLLDQRGEMDAALACYREAEATARQIGDEQTLAFVLTNRGVQCEWRGDPKSAIEYYGKAEDVSRRIGNRVRVAVTLGNRANALAQTGETDAALACYAEGEKIARALGAKQRVANILSSRGIAHLIRDELDEAERCNEEARTIAAELGDKRAIAQALGNLARIRVRRDDEESALAAYEEEHLILDEIGDQLLLGVNSCKRGQMLLALGRVEEAWEALGTGIAILDQMKSDRTPWYFIFKADLAQVASRRNDAEAAQRIGREALECAESLGLADHPHEGVQKSLADLARLLEPPR